MIAWMLRTLLATAALAGAAALADGLVRRAGLARRLVWATALALAAALPVLAALLPATSSAGALALPPEALNALARGTRAGAGPGAARAFPATLLLQAGWLLASGALLGMLAYAAWRLRRLCAHWPTVRVEGGEVVLSTGAGPLVVGLVRPRLVVPAWVISAPDAERRMVLAHEREHVRAGDARLLAAAALVPALAPWNLPAWWLVRWLREAVETDCDRRVLAGGFATADYGRLLLNTAAGARFGLVPGAALAEPKRLLERRLIAMTQTISDRRVRRLLPLALGAAALLVVACEMARPDASAPVSPVAPKASAAGATAADWAKGYAEGCIAGAVAAVGPRRDSMEVLSRAARCMNAQVVAMGGVQCVNSTCKKLPAKFVGVEVRTKDGVREVMVRPPTSILQGAQVPAHADGEMHMITAPRPPGAGEVEAMPANAYVEVDGKPAPSSVFKTLDPSRIRSISVLTGPQAAAYLGKNDRRAVIQITTKK